LKNLVRSLVLAAFLAVTFSTESLAQCINQGNIFPEPFSPINYTSCINRSLTGIYSITGRMYWNEGRRDYVRLRSNLFPFAYYTHDFTDLNDNLGHTGYWASNFPAPQYDSDDDEPRDGRYEEVEVVAFSKSFPNAYMEYFFTVHFQRGLLRLGGGIIDHTPAISVYTGAWQTYDYERSPYQQSYRNIGDRFVEELLDDGEQLPKEEQSEKINMSQQPLSVEEFKTQISSTGRTLKKFVLEYEVETKDGPQIVTVGGVPDKNELIPSEGLQAMLNDLPESFKITGFRGVVSYELVPIGKTDEKQDK